MLCVPHTDHIQHTMSTALHIKHFPTLILHKYINFNINWFGHTTKYKTFILPLF